MFCGEFNSEHTYNFSRWWRHYCDVIWQQNTEHSWSVYYFLHQLNYRNSQVINSIRTTEKNEKA